MTETIAEKLTRLANEYAEKRAAFRRWWDDEIARVYIELRDRDKAEGNDTSGKSVARRRALAHDIVMMSDEAEKRRSEVEAAEEAYRKVQRG